MRPNNIGGFRGNRYFSKFIHLGANDIGVEAVAHGVIDSKPTRIVLPEDTFTEKEKDVCYAFFDLMDVKFEAEHQALEDALGIQGLAAPRDKVHALVKQAEDAKRDIAVADKVLQVMTLEQQQLDLAKAAKTAEVAQLADRAAEIAEAHAVAQEAKQLELADLDSQLAAKRQMLAALAHASAVVGEAIATPAKAADP